MSLPRKAHLGPFTYRITDKPSDWHKLDERIRDTCWGYTDNINAVILIQPDLNPFLTRTVLLHELLHAAAFSGGVLDQRKRPEEDWVLVTAPPLMDALRRSPGVAAYLFGGK